MFIDASAVLSVSILTDPDPERDFVRNTGEAAFLLALPGGERGTAVVTASDWSSSSSLSGSKLAVLSSPELLVSSSSSESVKLDVGANSLAMDCKKEDFFFFCGFFCLCF